MQAQGTVTRYYDSESDRQWRSRIAAEKAAAELHARRIAEAEPATFDDYAEFLSGPQHPGQIFNGRRLEESPSWPRVVEVLDQLIPTKSYSFTFNSLVKLGRFRPKLTWVTGLRDGERVGRCHLRRGKPEELRNHQKGGEDRHPDHRRHTACAVCCQARHR